MQQVTMPQLGETVTEGTVTQWLKSEGEIVAVDEPLFEVSTDKVDTEVPSAHGGYLRSIVVGEGETVAIGTVVALITETVDEPLSEPATERPAGSTGKPDPVGPPPSADPDRPVRSDRASRSYGVRDQTRSSSVARPSGNGNGNGNGNGHVTRTAMLTPVVRRLLDEHDLRPTDVVGSGRDGRITRNDVLAAANQRTHGAPAVATPASPTGQTHQSNQTGAAPARGAVPVIEAGPDDRIVPFSKPRRVTAAHMVRSRATSAHALVVTEVDYHAVDLVRRDAGLSYLPFVARSVVDALGRFPHLNASVGDDELVVHGRVNLGIAVDLDGDALVVPVIRDATEKRLRAIAGEITELAQRGRAHRLTADDLTGGTFTLTSVGSYGTVMAAPIINQPQVAILSIDGVRPRPVAGKGTGGEWVVTVHPTGNLSLSFDHRAVDGAYAAAFLADVREGLQTRDWGTEL